MYSLVAKWTIQQGKEEAALTALSDLARQVQAHEADTLIYLVHVPDLSQASLPTPCNREVLFFEVYKDKNAFLAHVTGPTFTTFVREHLDLFLSTTSTSENGTKVKTPFVIVEFVERQAGFIRSAATEVSAPPNELSGDS